MPRCSGRVIQFPPAGRAAEEMLGVVFERIADALPDICLAECRSFLFMPGVGVPSHPQPFLGHFAPVFFLDFGAAPLCLQAAVFRAISIFLRLGRPVHPQPHSLSQLAKASVQPMVLGSLRQNAGQRRLARLDWLEPSADSSTCLPQRLRPAIFLLLVSTPWR